MSVTAGSIYPRPIERLARRRHGPLLGLPEGVPMASTGGGGRAEAGEDLFLRTFLPGDSPTIRSLRERIAMLNTDASLQLVKFVLIVGASGTGKNHVARVIAGHRRYLQVQN